MDPIHQEEKLQQVEKEERYDDQGGPRLVFPKLICPKKETQRKPCCKQNQFREGKV